MARYLIAALLVLVSVCSAAARDNWKTVGSVTFVDPFLEQTISIPPDSGMMRAVRFDVRGADVEIASLRIIYAAGRSQEIAVRSVFRAGTSSRRIDLPGQVQVVRQVVVVYRARGQATFNVVADVLEVPQWVQLGCKSVGFFVDRDVIPVDATDAVFAAIRLRVANLPVEFFDVTVVYGNGRRESVPVRAVIPPGGMTRAIDLTGRLRGISRIELLYRSSPTQRLSAVVCADGYRVPVY